MLGAMPPRAFAIESTRKERLIELSLSGRICSENNPGKVIR
jgi:hypothetical protein